MNLSELKENSKAQIVGFDKDLPPQHQLRLLEIGFAVGQVVRCVKKPPFHGPPIFEVSDGLFSIDHDLAKSIEIQMCEQRM
jgi:Fe2+ transport system protein FeoA